MQTSSDQFGAVQTSLDQFSSNQFSLVRTVSKIVRFNSSKLFDSSVQFERTANAIRNSSSQFIILVQLKIMFLKRNTTHRDLQIIADIREPYADLKGITVVLSPAQYKQISNMFLLIPIVNDFEIALLTLLASSELFCD